VVPGSHVFHGKVICIPAVCLPEPDQDMPYLAPYHWPVQNSVKFRENIEILWKWANQSINQSMRLFQVKNP